MKIESFCHRISHTQFEFEVTNKTNLNSKQRLGLVIENNCYFHLEF